MGFSSAEMEELNINRKLSVLKHRKKQAANDAQLLMNRIGLLQKEEDRARRKIDQTKERAEEILAMRNENEKRIQAFIDAATEERNVQRDLQQRNKEQDQENRRARMLQQKLLLDKKKTDVHVMHNEKEHLIRLMLTDQERDLKLKQKRRDDVRKMEENAKFRKEEERRENERRVKEIYDKKAADEEMEAMQAERLVKMLEKREREWIAKLQHAQDVQQNALKHLEEALINDPIASPGPGQANGQGLEHVRSSANTSGAHSSGSSTSYVTATPQPPARVSSAPTANSTANQQQQRQQLLAVKPPTTANMKSQKGVTRPPPGKSKKGSGKK